LKSGGTPGNKGGGRPPKAFKNFLAEMRQNPKVQEAFELAATDPDHKHFAAAMKLLADYDEDAPANLSTDERKKRVLELVKEAEKRRRQA
jgi:membrane glycosyltransferase